MGFRDWLTRRKTTDFAPVGSSHSFLFGPTSSGKQVTERSAMQMTAVYSCVRILAEAVAGLPLHVYRHGTDGGKEKAAEHPLYKVLHDQPNPEMKSFVFRETLMTHLLLWGNAYAPIIRNGRSDVIGLYPLMPSRVSVGRLDSGGTTNTSHGHSRTSFSPTASRSLGGVVGYEDDAKHHHWAVDAAVLQPLF